MNAVIEIGKIGEVVNPGPLDRLTGAPAFADRLEVRAVRPDLRMAVHAGLGRGDAGKCESLDCCVAITAVDAVIPHVVFMAELDWLLARKISLGVIRGPIELQEEPDDDDDKEESAEDSHLRNEVGASVKDLSHRRLISKRRQELALAIQLK